MRAWVKTLKAHATMNTGRAGPLRNIVRWANRFTTFRKAWDALTNRTCFEWLLDQADPAVAWWDGAGTLKSAKFADHVLENPSSNWCELHRQFWPKAGMKVAKALGLKWEK